MFVSIIRRNVLSLVGEIGNSDASAGFDHYKSEIYSRPCPKGDRKCKRDILNSVVA